jgi:hypothetical protein
MIHTIFTSINLVTNTTAGHKFAESLQQTSFSVTVFDFLSPPVKAYVLKIPSSSDQCFYTMVSTITRNPKFIIPLKVLTGRVLVKDVLYIIERITQDRQQTDKGSSLILLRLIVLKLFPPTNFSSPSLTEKRHVSLLVLFIY